MDTKQLAKMVEDLLNINRYDLFRPYSAVFEQAEMQQLNVAAQQEVNETALTPPLEG